MENDDSENTQSVFLSPRYRIVTDQYAGYEAQVWRWWWPFWVQLYTTNTHATVEDARYYINQHKHVKRRVVEYVTIKRSNNE